MKIHTNTSKHKRQMETLLQLRQLRLWEAVCSSFPVTPQRQQQVREWIQSAQLKEELERRSSTLRKKKNTTTDDHKTKN